MSFISKSSKSKDFTYWSKESILIENILWLKLGDFMLFNEFLPIIENVLWLKVKTLTRFNHKSTLIN